MLNALVPASRAGARTAFITRVGDDPFGAALLDAWRTEGVDTACAPLVPGENGVYFIAVDAQGEREFTYRRSGSAASQLSEAGPDPAYIAQARCLLLSGITQALSPQAQQATLAAARMARAAGVQVVFDPNYRPRLWAARGGLDAARAAWREVLPHVDLLLPSYPADAELLAPLPMEHAARQPVASAGAVIRRFGELCPQVALKCGAAGSQLLFYGLHRMVPAVRGARVVDSSGAGDAWNGVFLTALLDGAPPLVAARNANAPAAATLAHRGAIPPRTATAGTVQDASADARRSRARTPQKPVPPAGLAEPSALAATPAHLSIKEHHDAVAVVPVDGRAGVPGGGGSAIARLCGAAGGAAPD